MPSKPPVPLVPPPKLLLFGWYDVTNASYTRSPEDAAAAMAGGNTVLPLWGEAARVRAIDAANAAAAVPVEHAAEAFRFGAGALGTPVTARPRVAAPPYAGVLCTRCGPQPLSEAQYQDQRRTPGVPWECPRCYQAADFDERLWNRLHPNARVASEEPDDA